MMNSSHHWIIEAGQFKMVDSDNPRYGRYDRLSQIFGVFQGYMTMCSNKHVVKALYLHLNHGHIHETDVRFM